MSDLIVIEPGHRERRYWLDLWQYRELFAVLAWRDLSVRYKQTVIGVLWALIRPVLTMAVFTIVFGKIASLPSDGTAPYPLLVFAALLPWTLFSTGLSEASSSIVAHANLISKVYFPRLLVPAATIAVAIADFLVSFCVMIALGIWFHSLPGWQVIFLPFFIVLAFAATLGPALWIASLNVRYRDFRYVIPFVVQFGLYVSPVGFSSGAVPEEWRLIYQLNPVVGVIDGFRWCLLHGQSPLSLPTVAFSVAVTAWFLWFGIRQFRRTEASFADLI